MHTSTEPTIADTVSLTAEEYRRELTRLADTVRYFNGAGDKLTVPAVRSKRRRAGNNPIVATRRTREGRPVLVMGKRKAARHPWADRLHAARTGGFVVGQIFTDTDRVTACCYACGDRFTISTASATASDRVGFDRECRRHEARECVDGVTL